MDGALGKKVCPNFFFSGKGQLRQGQGQKNTDLSSFLSHLTRNWSENWNLSLKLKNQIKKFYLKMALGWLADINYANFWP